MNSAPRGGRQASQQDIKMLLKNSASQAATVMLDEEELPLSFSPEGARPSLENDLEEMLDQDENTTLWNMGANAADVAAVVDLLAAKTQLADGSQRKQNPPTITKPRCSFSQRLYGLVSVPVGGLTNV